MKREKVVTMGNSVVLPQGVVPESKQDAYFRITQSDEFKEVGAYNEVVRQKWAKMGLHYMHTSEIGTRLTLDRTRSGRGCTKASIFLEYLKIARLIYLWMFKHETFQEQYNTKTYREEGFEKIEDQWGHRYQAWNITRTP